MQSFLLFGLALAAATANAFSVRPGVESESWMTTIKDDTPLCELVLPGTHDAAAFDMGLIVGRQFVLTQKSNIADQLARGIRYVDFRVGMCEGTNDKFCMFHGPVYLNLNLDGALNMIKQFLAQHTSETVVMRLQHEHGGGLDDFQGFVERNYLTKDPTLWYAGKATKSAEAVTVGDVRGKILLLWSSGAKTSAFGYDYQVVNTRTIYEFNKLSEMSDAFQVRAQASNVVGWYENPTSGVVFDTVFGKRIPAHTIADTALYMRVHVTTTWASTPMKKGIISMDFPTDELIRKFIVVSLDFFSKHR